LLLIEPSPHSNFRPTFILAGLPYIVIAVVVVVSSSCYCCSCCYYSYRGWVLKCCSCWRIYKV